jgi:hypothetical protein
LRKYKKEIRLTPEDRRLLKQQLKPGVVIPMLLLFLGLIILLFLVVSDQINTEYISESEFIVLYISTLFFTTVILGYLISRKYLMDLRNGVKQIEIKRIEKKETIVSREAGSGTLYTGQPMKEVGVYAIIVDHTRFRIDKDRFDNCKENGQVEFHMGPISKHLIRIEPKKERTAWS